VLLGWKPIVSGKISKLRIEAISLLGASPLKGFAFALGTFALKV